MTAIKKVDDDRLPLVVGGDLNTYMGSKAVLDTVSEVAPRVNCGNQATHSWGVTLDHIFASLPETWSAQCVRGQSKHGSDHYPLVLSLSVAW